METNATSEGFAWGLPMRHCHKNDSSGLRNLFENTDNSSDFKKNTIKCSPKKQKFVPFKVFSLCHCSTAEKLKTGNDLDI